MSDDLKTKFEKFDKKVIELRDDLYNLRGSYDSELEDAIIESLIQFSTYHGILEKITRIYEKLWMVEIEKDQGEKDFVCSIKEAIKNYELDESIF
jgi:hypothetical protein